ncbi:hypothetical protein ACET3Z_031337 [Daucus carota]
MAWVVRGKDEIDKYKPHECPGYQSPEEQFTIKLYLDGKFEENPKSYRGGSVHYIDFCEGDQTSLLELYSMIVSCGSERSIPQRPINLNLPGAQFQSLGLLQTRVLSSIDCISLLGFLVGCKTRVTGPRTNQTCNSWSIELWASILFFIKCPQQQGGTECGLFVMRYMHEIFLLSQKNPNTNWKEGLGSRR